MHTRVLCFIAIVIILGGLGCLRLQIAYAAPYSNVDVNTAYTMITSDTYPDLVVLDVRTKGEYDGGHIYGAVWIPVLELETRIDELGGHEDHEIIVYCQSGGRSATASGILDAQGFLKVYNMLGGIMDWQNGGYPIWIATVHNVNTTVNYDTIQGALNAHQTLDGHTIRVDAGTYLEHVLVNKAVKLIGENENTTIIDGSLIGTVVKITTDNVTVQGFTLQNGGGHPNAGLHLYNSQGNTICSNRIRSNLFYGIWIEHSNNNNLSENTINDNRFNFGAVGDTSSDFHNNIDSSNTVDGKPVYYWINQHNQTIPSNAGYVAVIQSTNITARNLSLSSNYHGVLFVCTNNSLVFNVNVSKNVFGISLLHQSQFNTVTRNTVFENTNGMDVYNGSNNNTIYHNNFMNNTANHINLPTSNNTWDDGYPSGGNYWSDHGAQDVYRNSYQNETGSDGIADSPYNINGNNQDNYPLMKIHPWGSHDLGITNVAISKTTIKQGVDVSINITIFNYGNHTEDFNVTVYANTTIIDASENQSLATRNSTTINFTWNTTEIAKGDYRISANVSRVPGETDFIDNSYIDGIVTMLVPGHDLTVKDVTPSKTVVGRSHTISINVTVRNYGSHTETFNVTTYANVTTIGLETAHNILNGTSVILVFAWNTTDFIHGVYALTASASPVFNETDVVDNTRTNGWVVVTIVGDIDGDFDVDPVDVFSYLAPAYGTTTGHPAYNPNCDFDGDGDIDPVDVFSYLAPNYGQNVA